MFTEPLSPAGPTVLDAPPARDGMAPGALAARAPASIRAFEQRDIPRVAELFLKTFRAGRSDRGPDLCAAIEETYFGSPAYRPETGSIVHVDARGTVDGFMGVITIGLRLGARKLTGGVFSALMADRPDANPEVGVRLARAAIARPLDVIFTDTANRTSLDLSRALRFTVLPTQSLDWMKLLRPAGVGAYAASRGRPRLRRWLGAAASAIDARLPATALTAIDRRPLSGTLDRPVGVADFVGRAPGFLPQHRLRPAWEAEELAWLVARAGARTKNGPLHLREVLDRTGRCIGLYMLYAGPGLVGFALQVVARQGHESQVLGNLVARAEEFGAVAVRGASSPESIAGLIRQPGVVYRNTMSTVARTSDPEVAAALDSGQAMLGGLAGETWARVFGDDFT